MQCKFLQNFIDSFRGKRNYFLFDPNVNKKVFNCGEKFFYAGDDGNDIISEHLLSNKPELICRFGTLELETVRQFLKYKGFSGKRALSFHAKKDVIYNNYHREWFYNTAGFFPVDDYNMTAFACEQLRIIPHIDVLLARSEKFELEVCDKYLDKDARIVNCHYSSYPIVSQRPWTQHLKGKKVLVIHPFVETIKRQYDKRTLLFKEPDLMLPEFEMINMKPVQSIGRNKANIPYKTWFEALHAMKLEIQNYDFDIALIGAGAYGMFLGDYCKSIGKKAVHLGGATQLLFGIRGKRFDDSLYFDKFYNEHWTRPSKEETPDGAELFEHGTMAYW